MSEEKLVPKLRFSGFNDKWYKSNLGEVSSNEMYGMNSASKEYDGFNKYIRITDISETSNKFVPNPLTSPADDLDDKYKLQEGDMVFARTGASTGKTYLYDENDGTLYFAGFLIKFHIDNAVPKFIFYNTLKEEYLNWVSVMSVRSGQPGINSNEYKKLPLYLPSIEEQNKISEFLNIIDNKIELLEKKYEYYQDFKKYLMQQIFTQKLRFADFDDEWQSVKLGDFLTFYPTNSFSREKLNYESGNVKNIHYGDIHTKFPTILSIAGNKEVPYINDNIDLSKYKDNQYLQEGDLIITDASEDYADIGKAIEVKDINDEKVLAGLHTILARDEKNITVDGFKGYLFLTEDLKTNIKRIANGISVLGISKNNLSKLKVNIPSKQEQQEIVNLFLSIDKKIELFEYKYKKAQEFKKGLLQQMFI